MNRFKWCQHSFFTKGLTISTAQGGRGRKKIVERVTRSSSVPCYLSEAFDIRGMEVSKGGREWIINNPNNNEHKKGANAMFSDIRLVRLSTKRFIF